MPLSGTVAKELAEAQKGCKEWNIPGSRRGAVSYAESEWEAFFVEVTNSVGHRGSKAMMRYNVSKSACDLNNIPLSWPSHLPHAIFLIPLYYAPFPLQRLSWLYKVVKCYFQVVQHVFHVLHALCRRQMRRIKPKVCQAYKDVHRGRSGDVP